MALAAHDYVINTGMDSQRPFGSDTPYRVARIVQIQHYPVFPDARTVKGSPGRALWQANEDYPLAR